ncbi:MAG: hypothetical protein FWH34_00320 [Desulfovibrionaceae bacterium]|nr:hypothetical protein [Desulfovibrionaceae bacterium]
MSIRSWVNQNIGSEFSAPVICLYQGKPLLRAEWDIVLIYADVVFVPLPLGGGDGGGKQIIAMIGMAVLAIVAAVLQQYWAEGLIAAGWSSLAANAVAGLGAAAIMIGGSLLMNALFPTKPLPQGNLNTQSLESASPTYSTSISQNQARLWQMIPETFGTMEMVPDLAAQYYAEFQGNEQYLYALLCIGIGEYLIHRVSIEDTAIWENGASTGNFPEIELEIVNPGESITLFPDNVETSPEVSGQSLNKETLGPYTANSAGTQTTALALDVIFPRGLGYMGSGIGAHAVSLLFAGQQPFLLIFSHIMRQETVLPACSTAVHVFMEEDHAV